jgi:hypothetical protein
MRIGLMFMSSPTASPTKRGSFMNGTLRSGS